MGEIAKTVTQIESMVWGNPLIYLILLSSIYFTICFRGVQLRNLRHQIGLLIHKGEDSDAGFNRKEALFSIVGYRVGTANIAGVCSAVLFGGPGAVVWMLLCALVNASVSYAECTLGQIYKVKQDGFYRGGTYYYISRALGLKGLGTFFAGLTVVAVCLVGMGIQPNAIASAWKTSAGIPTWISGIMICACFFATISGGIKRIGKVASAVVPFMTITYFVLVIAVIVTNITMVPQMVGIMVSSAFGTNAIFGAMIGQAVIWGVKRSVNSSGAGMGAAVPTAAAADVAHPGAAGLISSFSVFADVLVCFGTGLIILLSDCFNVLSGETYLHLGQGSPILAEQAAINSAGVPWAQAAANTVVPGWGAAIIAVCLSFFAFTTMLNQYHQGETALSFLFKNADPKVRKNAIMFLRIAMPLLCIFFSITSTTFAWSLGTIGTGLMVWVNILVLLVLSPTLIKVYRDYATQLKTGIKEPVFNPEKVGIKNAEIWMEINRDKLSEKDMNPDS